MNPQQPQPLPPQTNQQPPAFGYPTAPNPYPMQNQPVNKKTIYLMLGGGLFVLILLLWLVFGGKSTPGQAEMKSVMQNTSDAVGVLDQYADETSFSGTKNDLALIRIILRGNYQNLNELYTKTYKPKKKFATVPRPDAKSKSTLDEAERDNQLDSRIIEVLKTKVAAAYNSLKLAEKNFNSKTSKQTLKSASDDLVSVSEILNDR
jgi:hypothetical protein